MYKCKFYYVLFDLLYNYERLKFFFRYMARRGKGSDEHSSPSVDNSNNLKVLY